MIELWDTQKPAVDAVLTQWDLGVKNTLLVSPTGSGKTMIYLACLALTVGENDRALIIAHRKELIEQPYDRIVDHFSEELGIPGVVMADQNDTHHLTTIATIQTLSSEGRLDAILAHGPITHLVTDECFVSGTLVDGKPIEDYSVGDDITTFNTSLYKREKGKVLSVMRRKAPDVLYEIEVDGRRIVCTKNHPFFVGCNTWKEAQALQVGDTVLKSSLQGVSYEDAKVTKNVYMPLVRKNFSITKENNLQCFLRTGACLLQPRMLQGVLSKSQLRDNGSYKPQIRIGENEKKQPHAQQRESRENETNASRNGVETTSARGKREAFTCSSKSSIRSPWMGDRVRCPLGSSKVQCSAPSLSLQNRHCRPQKKSRDRSRWGISLFSKEAIPRSEKRESVAGARVDYIAVLKRGRDERFGRMCPDGYVYNLEVERWHNYLIEGGIVVHNCHHSTATSYLALYERLRQENPGMLHLGVTATPRRTDEQGLVKVYDTVAYRETIPNLISTGTLAPFTALAVKLPVDVSKVRQTATGWDDEELGDVMSFRNAEEIVVETWQKYAKDRPTLAFTASVRQAYSLAERFREYGVAFEALDGTTPKGERERILSDFQEGRLQGLSNCALLGEGYDAPHASCLVQVRPTRSDLVYIQMIGRVLRTAPGKQDALVLDFVPAGARDLILADDVLGKPIKERKAIENAEDTGVVLSAFGINSDGTGIDGDPDKVIVEVLDYMTRKSILAWTFDGDFASAALDETKTLAVWMPDRDAVKRIDKANRLKRSGVWKEEWSAAYDRLCAQASYRLFVLEKGRRPDLLGAYQSWDEVVLSAKRYAKNNKSPVLAHRGNRIGHWRKKEASEKQRALLERLHIWEEGMTRGEAAQALTHFFARRQFGGAK